MWLYIVYYLVFYATSFPTYIETEQKQKNFLDKWEAVEFYHAALENGCDSVRMDSICSEKIILIK